MIQTFISSMLGPSGLILLKWYDEHSLYVNGIIILLAFIAVLAPRQTKMLKEKVTQFLSKTPFASDEKDRKAIEAAHARMNTMKARRR